MDPFSGIGSVAIACKQLDRKFGGCEIDEIYFKTIKDRLDNVYNDFNK